MSQLIGYAAETVARNYLLNQGLKWVISNYRSRCGEIDLVMQDKTHLVFIEVRSRVSQEYGGAIASITYHKRQKIIKTAHHYLMVNKLMNRCSCRFDVISIEGKNNQIDWIKNAFDAHF